ncbi:ATP-binding cassette sub- G member 1 [Allomyces arbusculus]|nr:ATP-binding cassette sub- G member 1 [Allomyces arbusculus]
MTNSDGHRSRYVSTSSTPLIAPAALAPAHEVDLDVTPAATGSRSRWQSGTTAVEFGIHQSNGHDNGSPPITASSTTFGASDPCLPEATTSGDHNGHGRVLLSFHDLTYSVMVAPRPAATNGNGAEQLPLPATASHGKRPRLSIGRRSADLVPKTILKDVTGFFAPGRLAAILGPSGSGKTTLLNCLAGLSKGGSMHGDVMLNGLSLDPFELRSVVGFVFQDDVIMETMTVNEALEMALALRNPPESAEDARRRMERIVDLLGLERARHTIIGSPAHKGVSGGERKRAAIGMELMGRPQVLLLDECTTGLDSFTAFTVMSILKKLAHLQQKTVVATLHQPSSEIFEMLDDVMILVDGQILYHGPTEDMVAYFTARNFPCPNHYNPADFVFQSVINNNPQGIDTLLLDYRKSVMPGQAAMVAALITALTLEADHHRRTSTASAMHVERRTLLSAHRERKRRRRIGNAPLEMTKYYPPFQQQFAYLTKRTWLNTIRNKLMLQTRIVQAVFLGVLLGLIYLNVRHSSPDPRAVAQSITGTYRPPGRNMPIFAVERHVFLREYVSGYYGVAAYFWSRTLVETPFQILYPVVFATIAYWIINFSSTVVGWLVYTMFAVLVSLVGNAFGIAMASLFEDIGIALTVVTLAILPLLLFGGLFVNSGTAPAWLVWLQWVSPIQYSFSGLMKYYWTDRTLGTLDGNEYLRQLGIAKKLPMGIDVIMLAVLWAVCTLAGYFGLRRLAHKIAGSRPRGLRKWFQRRRHSEGPVEQAGTERDDDAGEEDVELTTGGNVAEWGAPTTMQVGRVPRVVREHDGRD